MRIFLLLLFFSLNAFSQADRGGMGSGGGSGIVCFDSKEAADEVRANDGMVPDALIDNIMALQVLDLQLAFMKRGLSGEAPKLFLASPEQSVQDYLDILLLRLKQSYPTLHQSMRRDMGSLQRNIFYRMNPLKRVLDENDVGIEDSDYCTLTNFAVQYKFNSRPVIHLDERLFLHPKHSTSSKAILLLHEFIYSQLIKDGATDSRMVRDIIQDIL